MPAVIVRAPAKVNLILRVRGRRPDGYHEIASLMQRIDLCDEVALSLAGGELTVSTDHPEVPDGPENLAHRAAEVLLRSRDLGVGVRIQITKRIPVGAGLGGGSSDAAATLRGLNALLGLGLHPAELARLGAGLGADIPFFFAGGSGALVGGIGDQVEEVHGLPPLWYVVVNPGFSVSTRWVYENFALTTSGQDTSIAEVPDTLTAVSQALWNDLEEVTADRHPEIREMKQALLARGARGALMSGSGPTVFGLFPSEQEARAAAQGLDSPWRVWVAGSLGPEETEGGWRSQRSESFQSTRTSSGPM